jgi:coenzyme F420-reducing hydrogenase delta subunit/Na+-translocating ferredoxin:NAD+ oxidoreductase RNF subunit RnfB
VSSEPNPPDEEFPLKIKVENCGNCVFCVSVCPFEALKTDEKTKRVQLDQQKCRLCGLCYTSCPSGLIDIAYYNKDKLAERLERLMQENDSRTLVMACRGSEPRREAIAEGIGTDKFIEFTLPCVGRVPLPFFLAAAEKGVEKFALFSCDEDYCRFKKGSTAIGNTVNAANALLSDMGYPEDLVTLKRSANRVVPDTASKCMSCGNCVAMCPYQSPKLENGAARFDLAKCKGCGICVAECPKMCLELQGSESESVSRAIAALSAEAGGPKVIAFVCMWSEFSALDLAEHPAGLKLVPLPCAGRMEIVHVLDSLLSGIDGVLMVTCLEDECKQEKMGEKHARRYEAKLERLLNELGLAERVSIVSASPKQIGRFRRQLDELILRIHKMQRLGLSEKQREALEITRDVLQDVRIRWLFAREKEMLEKGNVYGEKVTPEMWDKVIATALADRLVQHAILHQSRGKAISAAELGRLLGLDPAVVLRHIIDLKRRNLMVMSHAHGAQLFAAKEV